MYDIDYYIIRRLQLADIWTQFIDAMFIDAMFIQNQSL